MNREKKNEKEKETKERVKWKKKNEEEKENEKTTWKRKFKLLRTPIEHDSSRSSVCLCLQSTPPRNNNHNSNCFFGQPEMKQTPTGDCYIKRRFVVRLRLFVSFVFSTYRRRRRRIQQVTSSALPDYFPPLLPHLVSARSAPTGRRNWTATASALCLDWTCLSLVELVWTLPSPRHVRISTH